MSFETPPNIDGLSTYVTGFIRKCIGDVVPTVKVCCFPNKKPWINTEVGAKLKDRATTHMATTDNPEAMAEDRNKYMKSHYDRCRVIKHAKGQYRNKVESYYTGSNASRVWQGLQSITDYKGRPSHDLPNNASLPDELNAFYAHLDNNNIMPGREGLV
jgi:hypothetical protein